MEDIGTIDLWRIFFELPMDQENLDIYFRGFVKVQLHREEREKSRKIFDLRPLRRINV